MSDAAIGKRGSGWHRVVGWFGIACLLLASGLSGYVGWLLWGTGIQTAHAQTLLRSEFHPAGSHPSALHPAAPHPLPGSAYGEILIPSIHVDMMVVEGTDYESLKKGPGHYTDTANPWDKTGRVGIAGHRTTYLHPFYNLDKLEAGDTITVRTANGTYDYKVTKVYVIPSVGSGVVLQQTQNPTMVLTTCNPRFSATQRLIVTADRADGAQK
jgi:LPXTG-site transpeptidase (sortase) family protein